MASTFPEIKSLIDGDIGSLDEITVSSDSTKRGATGQSSGGGLFISRTGVVSGSLSGGKIVLEGGSSEWDGAVSQDNIAPYYTRAQRTALSSIKRYVHEMSGAGFKDDGELQ